MDTTTYWYWEGNIVNSLISHLISRSWDIKSKADTRTKERGIDIHATKGEQILLIEAKGYPSHNYRNPTRASEVKRTKPSNQAKHWYAAALLTALRLQNKYPSAKIAIAFADFPRYRSLFDETCNALAKINVGVFMLNENGDVWEWGLELI